MVRLEVFLRSILSACWAPPSPVSLDGVPCFVAGTRDSRVNSRRAQRVSSRGPRIIPPPPSDSPSESRNPRSPPINVHTTHVTAVFLLSRPRSDPVYVYELPSTLIYSSTRLRVADVPAFNNACTHRPLNLALRKLRVYLG